MFRIPNASILYVGIISQNLYTEFSKIRFSENLEKNLCHKIQRHSLHQKPYFSSKNLYREKVSFSEFSLGHRQKIQLVQQQTFLYCFRVFDTFCGLIDIRCGNALIHGAFDLFCSCLFKFMSCTFKPQKCQTQPKLSNRIKRILNPFILPSSLLKPFSICQIKEKIFITICIKWVLDQPSNSYQIIC